VVAKRRAGSSRLGSSSSAKEGVRGRGWERGLVVGELGWGLFAGGEALVVVVVVGELRLGRLVVEGSRRGVGRRRR
jgi:hypothetical protein